MRFINSQNVQATRLMLRLGLCHVLPFCAVLCCVVLCCVLLCCVVLCFCVCHAVPCYAAQYCVVQVNTMLAEKATREAKGTKVGKPGTSTGLHSIAWHEHRTAQYRLARAQDCALQMHSCTVSPVLDRADIDRSGAPTLPPMTGDIETYHNPSPSSGPSPPNSDSTFTPTCIGRRQRNKKTHLSGTRKSLRFSEHGHQ